MFLIENTLLQLFSRVSVEPNLSVLGGKLSRRLVEGKPCVVRERVQADSLVKRAE